MGIGKVPVELSSAAPGFPVLTELGKRVEVLRIRRALSKQILARRVGISRQQLWRVVTGKSDLTSSLRTRLANALGVSPAELVVSSAITPRPDIGWDRRLDSYLADPNAIAQTLETLPDDEGGRSLKRALLNAIEDHAIARAHPLGVSFFDLRRRVVAGEL
jgi:transcriptional regulator with XRE-family HTH domain